MKKRASAPEIHAHILVACSGGADSVALARLLHEGGSKIELAHVHHGIRGRFADADARFVERLGAKLGVPFHLARVDVPKEAQKSGDSLEMAARRLRRAALQKIARRRKIRLIATGHNADDQVETLLFRIFKGTSIHGLAGIPEFWTDEQEISWIRPLLTVPRAKIIQFLNEIHQKWREDRTNADDFALRNRIRHEILPQIEKRINPSARQAILQLAKIAAAEDAFLAGICEKTPVSTLLEQPLAIQRRMMHEKLQKEGHKPSKITFSAIDEALKVAKSADLPTIGKKQQNLPRIGKSSKTDCLPAFLRKLPVSADFKKSRGFSKNSSEICLSAAAVGEKKLKLRRWKPGDRMQPLGMTGSKKLSDIFTDLKVPQAFRAKCVVVECGGEIAALAGWRVSRAFAVEGPRAASLRLKLEGAE